MFAFEPEFYDQNSEVQFNLGLKTVQQLNVKDGETILDIGCGTGHLTIEIAKRTPSGSLIGIDINPHMIAKAKENLHKCNMTNIQFITTEILRYHPNMQFDAIFSNSALHWVQETRQLYHKIYALLRPGGRLVAQTATKGSLTSFIPLFLTPIKPLQLSKYFTNWTYPIKLLSPQYLRKILVAIGYTDINLWVMKQKISFDSFEVLLGFLRSASLVPILSQLPPNQRQPYLDHLLNTLKTQDPHNLELIMKRLFINVRKKNQ
ncbi:MAG: methyltransferase domain-containing protein [Promethearchaeota archaeon]|nr:MAG: methyltransferase domain-containing protein [Candidatus Lokiarchaeota archaeon]